MLTEEQRTRRRRRQEAAYTVDRATCRHCGTDIVRIPGVAQIKWRHVLKVDGRERFGREQCATTYATPTEETP